MNKLILVGDQEDKLLNIDLYEYIKLLYKYGNKFIVCHVTEEEYKVMLEQIKNGCLNERLPRTTKDTIGYNKFRYMMAYNKKENNITVANYNDFDSIGTYTIDENGIKYNEERLQFPKDYSISRSIGGIKIYTTVSYEEVIKHYQNIEKEKNTPNTSLEKIISKIVDNPREFYIKVSRELSVEEREYIKKLIENKSCVNCSNISCRVETFEKNYDEGCSCIGWDNEEFIGRYKILTKK